MNRADARQVTWSATTPDLEQQPEVATGALRN
jgi:hypothetical protein